MKGKDVTVNKGIVVDVFTDQRFVLTSKAAVMPPAGSSTLQPTGQSGAVATGPPAATGSPVPNPGTVAVKSDPDGAEIELDGAFVGSTPATLAIAAGKHLLT